LKIITTLFIFNRISQRSKMQCRHCATEVAESANFCQNCGAARDGSGTLVAMSKAISLEIEGKIGRALAEMEKVVEDFPGGATFTYYGQLHLFRGDLPAAIQAFEKRAQR
jgi:hypothetical protein